MKTKFKLSHELKNKIKMDMGVSMETPVQTVEYAGHSVALPCNTIITGILYFDHHEKHLLRECIDWVTKYDMPLDIGRFKGLLPMQMNESEIKFSIDYYEEESWKDWFIDDDL